MGRQAPADERIRTAAREARRHEREHRPAAGSSMTGFLSLTLLLVLAILAAALVYLRPPSPGRPLTLDELSRAATCASGSSPACSGVSVRIARADFLDADHRVVGTLGGGEPFWTTYPSSDAATDDLVDKLINARVRVEVDSQSLKQIVHFVAQYLLPLVVLANLFALLFALIQRPGSGVSEFLRFGRAARRQQEHGRVRTTFADVAAAGEAVAELAEVRDHLAHPRRFAAMGALPPKGVLLVGPPGVGKTLLARAVAGEAEASFFSMAGSEFVEVLVGVGAARVRDLFRQARASAPAIIFLDEIDAVGRQRGAGFGQGHDEREQTLNELLAQMDGFTATEGIVVIGATNRPDILDPALLRAGRFDRHVTLERPDLQGRLDILRLHAQGRRLENAERHLPIIARDTPGFTGADLATVINEAALLAVREQAASIELPHLEEAVERAMTGPKRRGQVLSPEDKRRIAYHEAGHAVAAAALGRTDGLHKLSVIVRGRGIGHLAVLQEDRLVASSSAMMSQITVAMAGFAAEKMLFGEPSTGSEQDVERATELARDIAGRFGMSERLGPVRVLQPTREVFLGRDYLGARDVSQPTLEHLDSEVRRILEEQLAVARSLLEANRPALDSLAQELVVRETLQGAELSAALGVVRPAASPPPAAAGWPPPPPPPATGAQRR